ncbi:MAG: hypothetical protein ABI295_12045 [Xanthomarina sp.]
MKNLILILFIFGMTHHVPAQEINKDKPVYVVKDSEEAKSNTGFTEKIKEDASPEVLISQDSENKIKKETSKSKKEDAATIEKYKKDLSKSKHEQKKAQEAQKKSEKALKNKEKAQGAFEKSHKKLESTQKKYQKLKNKGKLSPVDEAKWLKKIEHLKIEIKKAEIKLIKA